jgi:hypothetical protein
VDWNKWCHSGSARAVLVVALVYSFPDVFNVIMALISPYTNQLIDQCFNLLFDFKWWYKLNFIWEIFAKPKTPQCIYCYLMKPEFTCYNLFDNLDAIILMTIGSGFLFWNQNFCLQIKKKTGKVNSCLIYNRKWQHRLLFQQTHVRYLFGMNNQRSFP